MTIQLQIYKLLIRSVYVRIVKIKEFDSVLSVYGQILGNHIIPQLRALQEEFE
jgi:hypothetical protein